jgi:DNA-binding transcriptional MerR regulator
VEDRQVQAPAAMTIHQLADISGVPVRRIRHYVAEGLLAPPHGRGRAAHYDRVHLDRVRQIQALRDANVGLDQIRRRLGEPRAAAGDVERDFETWQRWEIIPGLEIHMRANLEPEAVSLARVLANTARQLFLSEHNDT